MDNSTIDYKKLVRAARDSKNMTQEELSKLIGKRKTTISNYETGYSKPSLTSLEKIADALGCSIIDLLNMDPNIANQDKLKFPRALQPSSDRYIPFYTAKSMKSGNFEHPNFMDSYLTLPGFMFDKGEDFYFCIKMNDNSMTDEGISKNDYIIVRKIQNVQNKCLVAAQRISDGEVLIRRYFRDNHIIALMPSSGTDDFSIIRTDERNEEYKILGCVEKILTNLR